MAFREIDDDLREIFQNSLPPTKPHIGRPRCDLRGLLERHPVRPDHGMHQAVFRRTTVPDRWYTGKGAYQTVFLDLL